MTTAGDVLGGRYRLVRPLRVGAAGLWLGEALDGGAKVAVKLVDPKVVDGAAALEAAEATIARAAELDGANVARVLAHGVTGGAPFVVTELLEGQDLDERLRRVARLSLDSTARLVGEIADALAAAHARGLAHGALRPSKILLVHGTDAAKVLGLGLPRAGATPEALPFSSPDVLRGAPADDAADLWALGAIAYQCVVGRVPLSAVRAAHLLERIERGDRPTPPSR
ncbi:MAG TPA: protein kinase, partial [Minicystis sp.]|nr:protein kinase [Minicystis sp.]